MPCILGKELYIITKELCFRAKVPYILTKEAYILTKEAWMIQEDENGSVKEELGKGDVAQQTEAGTASADVRCVVCCV